MSDGGLLQWALCSCEHWLSFWRTLTLCCPATLVFRAAWARRTAPHVCLSSHVMWTRMPLSGLPAHLLQLQPPPPPAAAPLTHLIENPTHPPPATVSPASSSCLLPPCLSSHLELTERLVGCSWEGGEGVKGGWKWCCGMGG